MKTIELTSLLKLEPGQMAKPEVKGAKDVLLKVLRVGVCGSDVHYYETGRIGSMVVDFPFRLGHEFSAIVEEVGSGVTRCQVGDEVAVDPAMSCFECDQCLAGRENTCRKLTFLGCPGQAQGCLSEYIVMPEQSIFPTTGVISLEQAVLAEPLSIGVYAVRQGRVGKGTDIGILGAGPVGLCTMVGAQDFGAGDIFVTDKIKARVELAQQAGATWAGNPDKVDVVQKILDRQPAGLDVVFECAGEQETIDQAVALLKPGGTLSLIGIPREKRISMVIDQCRRKELTIVNVRRQNGCMQSAIDLIAAGNIDVNFMLTHDFGFDQTAEAFDLVANYRDGVIKALITTEA
jgi:L-iditol 2-dehydrogenase